MGWWLNSHNATRLWHCLSLFKVFAHQTPANLNSFLGVESACGSRERNGVDDVFEIQHPNQQPL